MHSVHGFNPRSRVHLIFEGVQAVGELIDQGEIRIDNGIEDEVGEVVWTGTA